MEYLKPFAELLHSISAVTTSNGTIPHEKVWYLPAEQHILEIIVSNVIFGTLLLMTLRRGKSALSSTPRHDDIQRLSLIGKILRFVLTVCFLYTIWHKYNGKKLALMIMPCHAVTLCYLFSLYSRRHSTAEFMFNVSVHFMFFTWLALLLPDHAGLKQFGEIPNFWVHHWVLFIIPIYLIATSHYNIDHADHYYFRLAAGFGALLHFNIMSIAGIISGHNVGYMLAPPPKTIIKGPYFRWGHAAFLVIMGWISGYLVPWLIVKAKDTFMRIFKSKRS